MHPTAFLVICGLLPFAHSEPSVHILSENLEQVLTSTTLEWRPTDGKDKDLLEFAVIAAYQHVEEQNEAEETENSLSGKPVYICRAKTNGIWLPGQLRPKKSVCIVSLYNKVVEDKTFEVLINIENSARLSWVLKNKYIMTPPGTVTVGEEINLRTFVARKEANSHDREGSLTYFVGHFNPNENFGVFHLVDQNNNEIKFEEGQLLVETEPIGYEMKVIKSDRLRSRHVRKPIILGHAILKNEESGLQKVETVISYNYTYSVFWGKGHGLLTGLPFNVTLSDGSKLETKWSIAYIRNKLEMAPIEKYLEEGTAVNVTLRGNYTESDVPYLGSVTSIYKDNERRDRLLRDSKREFVIKDVVAEFGPVYFLHNNSHVPTTTTTTTTTTTSTSTTSRSTSTTQEVTPIAPPEVEDSAVLKSKKSDLTSDNKKHENNSMQSDGSDPDGDALSLKKKDVSDDGNGCSTRSTNIPLVILGIVLLTHRVT